jgi:hypothetical protein
MAAHNHGILLLAGRLETAWWQDWVFPYATAILAPRGRPTFHLPDGSLPPGNSGAPCTLISYGEADARVLETCGLTGALTRWRMVGTNDDAWQWTHCGLRTAATDVP